MPDKQKSATIASLAVAGIIVAAGAGAAINANAETATPTPSSSASQSAPARTGGEQGPRGDGHGNHTEATTEQASQVSAALKAKDSAVTVERVMVDEDGSYDVVGTKDSERVMFEVGKDLKTVTERQGGPGGKGGHGERGGRFADASTDETAKVTAAVKAKDSAVTVERVMVDEDGSYDVAATKSGDRVMFEVSKDLKTVTQKEKPQR